MTRNDCLSDASNHVLFRSCYCAKLNLTQSQRYKQHRLLGNKKYLHFQQTGASVTSLCIYSTVPSPNSVTSTIRNDSPRPVKVIIWLWSVLCLLPKQLFFFNRGFSQVSSPSPLVCCLLLQSSDLAVDIPPQCTRQRCASIKDQTK